MQERKTFHGPTYRVQIQVFDYSDGAIPAWKDTPTKFAVTRLGQQYPKSASFSSAGDQIYYGDNFKQAVRCASALAHRDVSKELPKGWCKYNDSV